MLVQAGTILKATKELDESFFENAIILIVEKNENGATGFVCNKIFDRKLNELVEFRHSPSFPLYDGGPVGREPLHFIHHRPDLVPGGKEVAPHIYHSGDFKQAVTGINNKSITDADIKIFIGYCGWDAGELEAEIEEGSWEITNAKGIF